MIPDHEGEGEEEEELADLVARHEVRQLLRLDPELPLHRRQRRRQVSVAHAFNGGIWGISSTFRAHVIHTKRKHLAFL